MLLDRRSLITEALYVAVQWLTASRIFLSTHGFWLENVLIVTVSVACVLTKLNATSVNSLTSDELARNMSQSTSSRAACSIASEWKDQHVTSLFTGGSWTSLCLYSGVRKMAAWSNLHLHLPDAFIQSDLQCIQAIHLLSVSVFPGNQTHNLCAANAML